MPRDNDRHNDSPRGRRERPDGHKGRSGKPRGPEKKFAKRGFGAKKFDGERGGDKPRFSRDDRPRGDRPFRDRPARDGDGEKRAFKPRGDRPKFDRDGERRPFKPREDRGGDKRPYTPRARDRKGGPGDRKGDPGDRKGGPGDRDGTRPAGRFSDRKFGDKKPYASRERDGDKRPYSPRPPRDGRPPRRDRDEARPAGRFQDRKFRDRDGDRKRDPGDREFKARDRSNDKPWQKRDDRRGRDERPRFSRPREERERGERPFRERPKFDRPRENRDDRPRDRDFRERRPRPEGRTDWQEHPRSDKPFADRPRRDNEDDSKVFAKRPAFGGRGAYRERERDLDKPEVRDEPPRKKTGERIAKVLARAGLASRRDAEAMVVEGRVTVNGRVINSPALDVTVNDVIAVDGEKLPPRERTRLFLYHKPRGLMTTHADPEGRPTVFDNLPEGLPRLISIGRLDFNTEGLLLLTNDGGLARTLELPETGWLRRYRVRAHGDVTQAQLDELKAGVEVEGVKYGPIDATLERDQGANVWLVFAIREGKNREVRNVLAHLGLEVNRLIRVSYGPFQLGEIAEGAVEEVRTRVLREQLGEKVIARAGADFATPEQRAEEEEAEAPRGKKPFKPSGKSALVSDRKGRRVLVQRTGSEEARERNELEANGYGPPRRPKRGYHGKRDFRPRDE
jgi:23S rRNA pseudouridine2605 synthase